MTPSNPPALPRCRGTLSIPIGRPTDAQLHHLAELANKLNRPLPQPKTYEEATRWIDQLKTERDTR